MDKIDPLNQVAEFHRTFKHPVLDKPAIPSKDRCSLRVSLLSEEVAELQVAIENNDLIEIADALCDIQYVLSGAVLDICQIQSQIQNLSVQPLQESQNKCPDSGVGYCGLQSSARKSLS